MYYLERIKIEQLNVTASLAGWRKCAYATSDRYGIVMDTDKFFHGKFYIAAYQLKSDPCKMLFELNCSDIDHLNGHPVGEIINLDYKTLHPLVVGTDFEKYFVQVGDRMFFEYNKTVENGTRVSSDLICNSKLARFLDIYGTRLYLAIRFRNKVSSMDEATELYEHLVNVKKFLYENNNIHAGINRLIEDERSTIDKARKKIEKDNEARRLVVLSYNNAVAVLSKHGLSYKHQNKEKEQ